jgi:hypothetical protein
MLARLRTLVQLGLVERRGNGQDLHFALTEGTADPLAAVYRTPLRPVTAPEKALRRFAAVLNRPVTLAPGSTAHTEITAAVAGARSAVGGAGPAAADRPQPSPDDPVPDE